MQVVDRGGFTAASCTLRTPKSTLSHRIQQLEASLGVRLLNRTSRKFGMTDAGVDFYGHAVAALRELTTDAPRDSVNKLFFVNLGGYDPREFGELHKNILLVALDAKAAKAKALSQIQRWSEPHKDNLFEVEAAVDVSASMRRYGFFLQLTKAAVEKPFTFVCEYLPIA